MEVVIQNGRIVIVSPAAARLQKEIERLAFEARKQERT